jgi:DNA polymerase II large subunit
MNQLKMTPAYRAYFDGLEAELAKIYGIAQNARAKGLDASVEVEPKITHDIAERVEKMLGPPGISKRMHELEALDRRDIAFKVAEEICLGRFGSMDKKKAADQAIRTALAILTEAVTIAPLEGIPKIEIKQNPDRTLFLSIYFAGPIRPAGGTAQALTLIVADLTRRTLGLDKWQPSEQVVQRFVEEVRLYERTVRRFQYHITDEDIELAIRSMPVEPTGVSTDPFEVSNYRDVPGIETNRLRGGALIVVVDGVIGRARKLYGNCEKLGIQGWDWLKLMGRRKPKTDDEKEVPATAAFMEEIIVGRPVFSFPGAVGGFRLRYGRARNTGLAANGVHPATMIVLNRFLATGVQMRTELPGKSTATCPVDSIEPPVVRLRDGSVVRVDSVELAEQVLPSIDRILFLGDYLSNAGDWVQNNKPLLPSGYDEHQWLSDLEASCRRLGKGAAEDLADLPAERIQYLRASPSNHPSASEALALTSIDVPLHPRWNHHWTALTKEEVIALRGALAAQWSKGATSVKNDPSVKALLEKLLVPHTVKEGRILFGEDAVVIERVIALDRQYSEIAGGSPLEIVSRLAGFTVRDKAPVFVGARMGRPEKAKER